MLSSRVRFTKKKLRFWLLFCSRTGRSRAKHKKVSWHAPKTSRETCSNALLLFRQSGKQSIAGLIYGRERGKKSRKTVDKADSMQQAIFRFTFFSSASQFMFRSLRSDVFKFFLSENWFFCGFFSKRRILLVSSFLLFIKRLDFLWTSNRRVSEENRSEEYEKKKLKKLKKFHEWKVSRSRSIYRII
jgi:hypothetical protein